MNATHHWTFSQCLYLVQLLMYLVCAWLCGWRFARSPAGLLGPIGFALLFVHRLSRLLIGLTWASTRFMYAAMGFELLFWLVDFMAWACIIAAIATARVAEKKPME